MQCIKQLTTFVTYTVQHKQAQWFTTFKIGPWKSFKTIHETYKTFKFQCLWSIHRWTSRNKDQIRNLHCGYFQDTM